MSEFSAGHWVVVAIIGFVIYKMVKASRGKGGKTMFCKSCGSVGTTKTLVKGNLMIEIVLWLCFLVPGLIYSIWRLSSKAAACPECGSVDLVPDGSPVAMAAKKTLGM